MITMLESMQQARADKTTTRYERGKKKRTHTKKDRLTKLQRNTMTTIA